MNGLVGLLELVDVLVFYRDWRDGCPDCGSEARVADDEGSGSLRCGSWSGDPCGRRWQRGEA